MKIRTTIKSLCVSVTLCLALLSGYVYASDKLNIAAASNLTYVMPELIKAFERDNTNIKVRLSLASTGNIYAQIKNGAPYDIFLAADELRPGLLYETGRTRGKPFTYARGRLILWIQRNEGLPEGLDALLSPHVKKIAMANPRHAPYGKAARAALKKAGLWDRLKEKFIYGENISQTAQFVLSGSAQAGFIAESMLRSSARQAGSFYRIPDDVAAPIVQRGVLIKRGGQVSNPALLFKEFLLSEKAKGIFKSFAYEVE